MNSPAKTEERKNSKSRLLLYQKSLQKSSGASVFGTVRHIPDDSAAEFTEVDQKRQKVQDPRHEILKNHKFSYFSRIPCLESPFLRKISGTIDRPERFVYN